MCICVNCRHVHNCTTYELIQKQHNSNINHKSFCFIPINTLININISNSDSHIQFDWDLVECLSFTEEPGKWLYL